MSDQNIEKTTETLQTLEQQSTTIFFISENLINATTADRPTNRAEGVTEIPSALTALLQDSGRDTSGLNLTEQHNLQKLEQVLCQLDDENYEYKDGEFTGFSKNVRIRGAIALGLATESGKVGLSDEAYFEVSARRKKLNQLSQEGYFADDLNLHEKTSFQRKLLAYQEPLIGKILGLSVDFDVKTIKALPSPEDIKSQGILVRQSTIGPKIFFITPNRRPRNDGIIDPLEFIELLCEDDLVAWKSDLEDASLGCNSAGFVNIDNLPPRVNGRYQMSFNEPTSEFYEDDSIEGEILRLRFRSKSLSYGVINNAEISGKVNKCKTLKETVAQILDSEDKDLARSTNRVLIELFKSYHVSQEDFLSLGRSLGILDESSSIDPTQSFPQFLQSELGNETYFDLIKNTFINDPSIFGSYLADETGNRGRLEESLGELGYV